MKYLWNQAKWPAVGATVGVSGAGEHVAWELVAESDLGGLRWK